MFELKCSNCGSPLEIDENHIIAFCPYCGKKITFDAEQLSAILLEKEKTKQIQIQLEHEEKMKKEENENNIKEVWQVAKLWLFLMLFIGIIYALAVIFDLH